MKINHGGVHKIISWEGMEYEIHFGCIECEHENIRTHALFKRDLETCRTFRPPDLNEYRETAIER